MRIRTGYSFRAAFGHLKEVKARLETIGWKRFPISDRNSTYGFSKWAKLVESPIFGVELGVVPDIQQMETKYQVTSTISFFAIDDVEPLHLLVGMATSAKKANEEGIEKIAPPTLTYESALKKSGNVIRVLGSLCDLDMVDPKTDNLFVALSPSLPYATYIEAKKRKFRFLASSDNSYTNEGDREVYRIALWRNADTQTYPQHILSDEELRAALSYVDKAALIKALSNRDEAMSLCQAKLNKATLFIPEKKLSLKRMCELGADKKGIDLRNKVYANRLQYELKLISDKKFEDYFYIIADIIAFAKARMIVGPARGSSAGSLVCYLLDITTVNPIEYGLIFERFIDINRSDLPDIDIDFDDAQRHTVFEYIENKYGREHVARLGTVGTYQPRSALNTAATALQVPKFRIEQLGDSIVHRYSGDARASQQTEDTMRDTEIGRKLLEDFPAMILASRLEDHPTNAGQHAAGMVVTADPISKYVAVDNRTFSTMCDKGDAEALNLLKIDMLGLTQLSIFARAIELIGLTDHASSPDEAGLVLNAFFDRIPLNDPKAFDQINRRRFSGIFQFNGIALQNVAKRVIVDKLDDIIALTALARPGPIASGGATKWQDRRNGTYPVEYPHKVFEPYLRDTLGVVIYQEQIMNIAREIGGLSWSEVSTLRKAMSKSMGKEFFDQFGNPWKVGAISKGVSQEVADKVWDDMCAYGSWSFNKSHAVSYGLISYYCAWMKVHYPLEFAAASLDAEALPFRQIAILKELAQDGITYQPIDLIHSEMKWNIGKKGKSRYLVGPLTLAHGIGEKTALKLISDRDAGKPFSEAMTGKLLKKTELDSLHPIGDAITVLHPHLPSSGIITAPTPIGDIVQGATRNERVVLGVVTRVMPKDDNDLSSVAKRGYAVDGPHYSLNMFFLDDTGEILVKIGRRDYERLNARRIIERGRPGKSIYAAKGYCPKDFRMIWVSNIKYMGDMDVNFRSTEDEEEQREALAMAEALDKDAYEPESLIADQLKIGDQRKISKKGIPNAKKQSSTVAVKRKRSGNPVPAKKAKAAKKGR